MPPTSGGGLDVERRRRHGPLGSVDRVVDGVLHRHCRVDPREARCGAVGTHPVEHHLLAPVGEPSSDPTAGGQEELVPRVGDVAVRSRIPPVGRRRRHPPTRLRRPHHPIRPRRRTRAAVRALHRDCRRSHTSRASAGSLSPAASTTAWDEADAKCTTANVRQGAIGRALPIAQSHCRLRTSTRRPYLRIRRSTGTRARRDPRSRRCHSDRRRPQRGSTSRPHRPGLCEPLSFDPKKFGAPRW